jgi:hypothetical protein
MIVQCKAGTTNEIQLARGKTLQITNRPSEWPCAQRESEMEVRPPKKIGATLDGVN